MKRILNVLIAAFVLTLVPAMYASAQWEYKGDYYEGLAVVKDANGNDHYIDKTGKIVE